jgi:biopolymer transport protein ExbD
VRFAKTLNVAPLVAVLLILAATLGCAGPTSVGLPLRLGKMEPCYPGDRRVVVIQVLTGGSVKINVDPVHRTELGEKLDDIFRTRAARLAYVTADSDVAFSEVAGVIDTATEHLDHVALLPRSQVLDRKPYPAELDVCVTMSFSARDANTSDRQLSVWH